MWPNKVLLILVVVAFVLAALTPSVTAEEKPAESGWEFQIAPYLWALSMDGNATVKGWKRTSMLASTTSGMS
jgi:hypothetical protein